MPRRRGDRKNRLLRGRALEENEIAALVHVWRRMLAAEQRHDHDALPFSRIA
jgi:hypothetical protein